VDCLATEPTPHTWANVIHPLFSACEIVSLVDRVLCEKEKI
jgi:hypothetical protein